MNTDTIMLFFTCYSKYIWRNRVGFNESIFKLFYSIGADCEMPLESISAYVACSKNGGFQFSDFLAAYQNLKTEFDIKEISDENGMYFLEFTQRQIIDIYSFFTEDEIQNMEQFAFYFYTYCLEIYRQQIGSSLIMGPLDAQNSCFRSLPQ